MKNMRRIVRLLLLPACLLAAGPAALAQEVVRVAAVVDEEEVTVIDLIGRTDLIIFSSRLPNTPEVRQRTMRQALRKLIDESLQVQEATKLGFKVNESEIEGRLNKIAGENNIPAGQLGAYLRKSGVDVESLKAQILASFAWSYVVRQRLQKQIEIGSEEVDEAMQIIEENSDKPRHLVSEIFLATDDPSQDEQVRQSALRIVQQIRNGGNFVALARAFSQNAAAAVGGDLGWLIQGQMDEAVERVLASMRPGNLSNPVRGVSGYHILLLRDRRQPGGGGLNQMTVKLKQVVLPLPVEATEEEIRSVRAAAEAIRDRISGCDSLGEVDAMPGQATVIDVGTVKLGELAAHLRPVVAGLLPDQFSDPLLGKTSIAMLIVCERTVPEEKLPDREQIRQQLTLGKVELLARRYLRDLRRAAFIDIRAWSASQ